MDSPASLEASSTFTATLTLELSYEGESAARRVRPDQIAALLDDLGWFCGIAQLLGDPQSTRSSTAPEEPDALAHEFEPILLWTHYGSPFLATIGFVGEVAKNAGGLWMLILAMRYLAKADLLVKTDREEQRYRLLRARLRAERTEALLKAGDQLSHSDPDVREDAKRELRRGGREVSPEIADGLGARRSHWQDWQTIDATLDLEGDESD